MQHYDFHRTFRSLYDHALGRYAAGTATAAEMFTPEQKGLIASLGLRAQDFYDYAEDAQRGGEPDFETALLIESVRRDYFLSVQRGLRSTAVLDEASMPAKSAQVRGLEWLPRILPKVRAKLRGELPDNLMYGCGGDRRFFRTHDIHPAEFLALAWRHLDDDAAIIEWVVARARAAGSLPAGA